MKHVLTSEALLDSTVAPCVGAWIETWNTTTSSVVADGRTLRGCVD